MGDVIGEKAGSDWIMELSSAIVSRRAWSIVGLAALQICRTGEAILRHHPPLPII